MRICHTVCLVVFTFASIHLSFAQAPAGGVFQRYDRNGDGKVTPDELPDKATFARFDLNKDGAITLEEYNQVAGGATPAGPSKPTATPAGNAGAAKTPSPMEWFNQADRNKDGKLSLLEAPSPQFKQLDTDGDGFVTLAEYKAFLNRQALKMLDKDGDGKISQTEFNKLYRDADHYFRTRQREAQPADGRTLPSPLPVKADPLGLRFTQDYFPGTKDPQGRLIAATEANHLVGASRATVRQLRGDLSQSADSRPGFPGVRRSCAKRRQRARGWWTLIWDRRPYRVEALASLTFTTDAKVANSSNPSRVWWPHAGRRTRRSWYAMIATRQMGRKSSVVAGPSLPLGSVFTARSFGNHVDRKTGIHHALRRCVEGQATPWASTARSIYPSRL